MDATVTDFAAAEDDACGFVMGSSAVTGETFVDIVIFSLGRRWGWCIDQLRAVGKGTLGSPRQHVYVE